MNRSSISMPFCSLFSILAHSILCVFAAHWRVLILGKQLLLLSLSLLDLDAQRQTKNNDGMSTKTKREWIKSESHSRKPLPGFVDSARNKCESFFFAHFQYMQIALMRRSRLTQHAFAHDTSKIFTFSVGFRSNTALTRLEMCAKNGVCFWDIYACIVRPRIAMLSCRWMSRIADADEMITICVRSFLWHYQSG